MLSSMQRGFAAVLADRSVVAWGMDGEGGDSSTVQSQQLNGNEAGQSKDAAQIVGDGYTFLAWSMALSKPGGDRHCSCVQHRLQNATTICSTYEAAAALLSTGSVVTWGDASSGGDSSSAQPQLRNVQRLYGNTQAFAAVLLNGCIVTWGDGNSGGDNASVQEQISFS
eukprot:s1031_g28.t1